MKRRMVLMGAAAVALPHAALAAARRIGWLSPFSADSAQLLLDSITLRRFQITASNAAARALGVTLPRELLLQANEVIE